MTQLAKVYLYGRFRIESADGENLTPKSAKAQGILALLAASPRSERGRRWLQDRLWSDRGASQGAASLRQALTDIRKTFGPHADLLISDRESVALNTDLVDILDAGECAPDDPSAEFLEGIDIRDPEFENWLASARRATTGETQSTQLNTAPTALPPLAKFDLQESQVLPPRPPSWKRLSFVMVGGHGADMQLAWAENLLIDSASRSLLEIYSADIILAQNERTAGGDLRILVQYNHNDDASLALRVVLDEPHTQRRIWSMSRVIKKEDVQANTSPEIAQIVSLLNDAVGEHIGKPRSSILMLSEPNQMCRMAIDKMFSMRPEEAIEADQLLAQAYDLDPKAIYLGWRAQLRTIQCAERHMQDNAEYIESARSFTARALEMEPMNSMVLATSASARLIIDRDVNGSLHLARRGVGLNSANPMGWLVLSMGKLYSGDAKEAMNMARLARRITALSPHGFFWELQQALSALVLGDLDEALAHFEATGAGNQYCRPVLRYLIALYAHAGEDEKALLTAQKLRKLEDDFSIERLVNDRDYPASLIWRAEALDKERLAALI